MTEEDTTKPFHLEPDNAGKRSKEVSVLFEELPCQPIDRWTCPVGLGRFVVYGDEFSIRIAMEEPSIGNFAKQID